MRVSEEECRGQPAETLPCPISQQGVADGKERRVEGMDTEAGRRRRRLTAFTPHLTKQKQSNLVITHPSSASVDSLCVHPSAPWGHRVVTLMTSGMGNEKHLLSA